MLWDFETRGVARVLSGGHAASVVSLSWSHDGRRLASACADSQLRVWDVLSAQPSPAVKLAGKPVRRRAGGAAPPVMHVLTHLRPRLSRRW